MSMEKCAIVKEWPLVDQPVARRLVHHSISSFVGKSEDREVLFATTVMGPLAITRIGNLIPHLVYESPSILIASERIREAWHGLPNVHFRPAFMEKLVYWPHLDRLPDFEKDEDEGFMGPSNWDTWLMNEPDCPRLHEGLLDYWLIALPFINRHVFPGFLDRLYSDKGVSFLSTFAELRELPNYITDELIREFPISSYMGNLIMSLEHGRAVEPYLDPGFFRVMTFDELRNIKDL
jgi:hypothetical protein